MKYNFKVDRCSKCIMPECKEHVNLNENGVCSICQEMHEINTPKSITENDDRTELLKKRVERYKKEQGYDCAVSISGGKDSVMALYIAKKVLNLNPLAIFIDNGFALDEMYNNIRNATTILNTDLVVFKASDMLTLFPEFIKSGKDIYYCRVCHAFLNLFVNQICEKYDIELVLGGYTKGQQYIQNKELFWIYEKSDRNTMDLLSEMPGYEKYVELFKSQTAYFRKYYPRIVQLSPFKYMKWDENEILDLITRELKFQLPEHSWPDKSTNCSFNYVAQYLAEKQFGYAQHETELSGLVRNGELSRDRALDIIETPITEGDLSKPLSQIGLKLKDII